MSVALLFLALASPAAAGDFILATGPEVELRNSGTWARAIATTDGWRLAHASNGDFYIATLSKTGDGLGDWEMERDSRVQLTQHGELKDHAIRRCPDGTYLHLASANVDQPNDSAYGWRYSADWEVLAQAPIEEREGARAHNDMALYCSALGAGVAFGGKEGPPAILSIDADLGASMARELPFDVRPTGAGMWVDPASEQIMMFYTDFSGNLHKLDMDPDLNTIGTNSRPVAPEGLRAYWPQGVLRVGDYWLIAHMVRPHETSVGGDDGNVRIVVVDDALQIQDEALLTDNPIEEAGMRPWLARQGDLVLMSYDRQRQHTVLEIRLDLDAFGVDPDEDTGWDGSDGWGGSSGGGAGDDTGGDDDDSDARSGGCGGCAVPGPAPLGLFTVAGLLAVARRRD